MGRLGAIAVTAAAGALITATYGVPTLVIFTAGVLLGALNVNMARKD